MELLRDWSHLDKKPKKKKKKFISRKGKVRKNVVVLTNESLPCRKCKKPMQRRAHEHILEKQLRKNYYFTEWDYCLTCHAIYQYEQYKVYNNHDEELERQEEHLRLI